MKSRITWPRAGFVLPIAVAVLCLFSGGRSHAVSTGVVISQIYGGGGNSGATYTHDFIELFNRGTSPVSIAGWSLQYASSTGTGNLGASAAQLTPLSGTIPAGGYLLVQEASTAAVGSAIPAPDVTDSTPIAMSSTSGKVALVSSTSPLNCNGTPTACMQGQLALIVDLVGWGNANFFEGGGPAPGTSNTTVVLRNNGGCADTDNNHLDFSAAVPSPRSSASPLAPCAGADAAPNVSTTVPSNGATNVAAGANITVTFNEPVTVAGTWFTLGCTVTGAKTATVTGGPVAFTIDPIADFVGGESCTLAILAASVTDQDTADPPDVMAANVTITFSVLDVCVAPFTAISAIQGAGGTAAVTGTVTTRGVVVGDYEGASPALRGFYVQDSTGDGHTATSDGLFVFNGNNNSVSLGDVVVVAGTAGEFQGQTQISATSVTRCGTGTVTPVDVTLPVPDATFLERFEGMLVNLPQTLSVTEHFELARFGDVVVSSGGRLRQPTDVTSPGALAAAVQAQNDLNRLIIDDALNSQYADPILFGRGGAPLSASNTLRGGDTVTGVVGVMTYTWAGNNASGNAYRVRPIDALGGSVMFAPANARPASAPAPATGALRVASMNLLNFFNTFGSNACTNGVGGAATDCRGADDAAEFARQWPKTVAAIVGTQADVVGLVEMENDGYGQASAIQFLVDQLNAATGPGTYAFVDADAATGQLNALGTDAIKVGLIYKPAKVTAVGQTAALNSVAFVNGGDAWPRNRPALAQAFEEFATGARFVLAVNHFKSKGSGCDAPDAGDGQGNCNAVRVQAAAELSAWLSGDPTGLGDPDVLVVGDLNSYGEEDPITTLRQTGYINLLPAFGGGFSYVFDGQWGSLDHAMATLSLRAQVVAAREWTINADEPNALDYNTDFKTPGLIASLYAADEFRAADHNPLLVDMALKASVDATADVSAGAHLILVQSAGSGAGDAGSQTNVTATAKFKKGSAEPQGQLMIMVRRTEADGLHIYQIKATSLVSLVRDQASGQATIIANATIEDVTSPRTSRLVDSRARVRVTLGDNGEPGIRSDTIGVTVLNRSGALWFSSHWNGVATVAQTIAGGNVQVR